MAAPGARGDGESYSAPAEMFIRAGAHYVVPDFSLVQDAGGDLLPMAEQVCRAIAWVYRNAASFGGDPDRLYVGGHSSGAHLAAVALTTDWPGEFDLPADIIKGGLCSSGMYELAPVRLSHRSSYVKFTDEMVEKLSPMRHLDRLRAPLIVSYGTYETPGIPAPGPGLRRRDRGRRQAGRAAGRRELQPHRTARRPCAIPMGCSAPRCST